MSDAIRQAEMHEDSGDAVSARAAYLRVSFLEEEIAAILAPSTTQGAIARCGALQAAVSAGQFTRVQDLSAIYLAEPGLPEGDRWEIQHLAADAQHELDGRTPTFQIVPDARFRIAA